MIRFRLIKGRDYSKYYKVRKDENCKPYLVNSNKYISVSHQGNWTLIAISNSPIGIDIERMRQYKESLPKYLEMLDYNNKRRNFNEENVNVNINVNANKNVNEEISYEKAYSHNKSHLFNKAKRTSKYKLFKEWTRREAYIKKNNLKLNQISTLTGQMDGKFKTILLYPYVISINY